jgi:hypothetical protein
LAGGFFFVSGVWPAGAGCASISPREVCANAHGLSVTAATPDKIVLASRKYREGLMLMLRSKPRQPRGGSNIQDRCKGLMPLMMLLQRPPQRAPESSVPS